LRQRTQRYGSQGRRPANLGSHSCASENTIELAQIGQITTTRTSQMTELNQSIAKN
jgi:hypothetical protein